jgi:hypothetical protein
MPLSLHFCIDWSVQAVVTKAKWIRVEWAVTKKLGGAQGLDLTSTWADAGINAANSIIELTITFMVLFSLQCQS